MKRDKIIMSLLTYIIIVLLGILIGMGLSPSPEKDRLGNPIELINKNVIMEDGNVLTVGELIEVYNELNH